MYESKCTVICCTSFYIDVYVLGHCQGNLLLIFNSSIYFVMVTMSRLHCDFQWASMDVLLVVGHYGGVCGTAKCEKNNKR